MAEMRVLFVDDDEGQRDLFATAIDDWNAENAPKRFILTMAADAPEAWVSLEAGRFDCAMFDLKLPGPDGIGLRLTGNELARTAISDYGIPVGIISGEPEDFESPIPNQGLMQTFAKTPEAANEAVNWLAGLWDMMIVLGMARRRIRQAEADIFMKRLWSNWAQYAQLTGAPEERLGPIVTRQFASHIAETLGMDSEENPGWHPFESWIQPPLDTTRLQTGDILRRADGLWVVLTPPCDMKPGKVSSVILAHCDDQLPAGWDEKVERLSTALANGEVSRNLRGFFSDLVNQNLEGFRHFLPPLSGRPMMVNFKTLIAIQYEELMAIRGDRVATIAGPFLPNLTQRFGAYFSRVGQPNIDTDLFANA